MPKSRQKKKKPSRGARESKGNLPPVVNLVPLIRCVRRFYATETGASSITTNDIFGALGGICYVANTTLRAIASTIRVRKVVMYPPAGTSTNVINDVVFSLNDLTRAKDTEFNSAIPNGITNTRAVTSVPPAGTTASMWMTAGSADSTFMALAYGDGCIIDLHVEYTQSVNLGGATLTVGTATLGAAYFLALDGASTNILVPVGMPTTSVKGPASSGFQPIPGSNGQIKLTALAQRKTDVPASAGGVPTIKGETAPVIKQDAGDSKSGEKWGDVDDDDDTSVFADFVRWKQLTQGRSAAVTTVVTAARA